jgi:hopanoid biosynthesis associated RND transporter like protein HpnN
MSKTTDNIVVNAIHWWEENVLNRPWLLIILSLLACAAAGKYTMDNLTVNTNTADMISIKLPFQQNRIRLETAFPQDDSTVLLMVEGKTPEHTSDAVDRIRAGLAAAKSDIKSYYLPEEGEFFTRNGMLYLSDDKLQDLSKTLAEAQPFIGRLAQDNSIQGLFGILRQALDGSADAVDMNFDPVLKKITEAVLANKQGAPYQLSWQQLMLNQQEGVGITKRFINVTPTLHFEEFLPAEKSINAINTVVAQALNQDLKDVSVRMTGEVVLEHEEMLTIGQGTTIAAGASLLLVCLTLWIAYRSFKLMFATFFTLSVGLVYSLAFATVSIGHLNLISIAFAVLFIGMGDAYSSHFCLRYRELIVRGMEHRDALRATLTSTGASLILCTLTAAIGLFAFIPTNYIGVSELGVIAGTSMFIALFTTFTILPALMKIMPLKRPEKRPKTKKGALLVSNWPLRFARPIRWITVVLTLGACVLVTKVQVDFNPLNLRDPNSESVKTFKYLLQSKDTSPMTLASLAASEAEVKDKKARFEQLPTVDKVVSILDFIPENQEAKLAAIEDLALIVGPAVENFPPVKAGGASLDALVSFDETLVKVLAKGPNATIEALHNALQADIDQLRQQAPETAQSQLDKLQTSLLSALPSTIRKLQSSLQPETVSLETLPTDLRERWLSQSGIYRIQIFPKKDLNDLNDLREFIQEAQKVDTDVTDLPVTYLESMNEVVKAFVEAFTIALAAITLLLLIILRSVKDTLLVLLPLLLAALFTAATTVVIDLPFNFANIIALPLLFGLGVDSGIHMAHRLHYLQNSDENLLSSSEAQGVFYAALTTIWSFSSLAFTAHQGTASMGMLLTIGLFLTLFCALVVLPAFSELRFRNGNGKRNHAH